MAFRWSDFADLVEARMRRLGLADDIADAILVGWSVLQNFVDTYDLPAYYRFNDAIFRTRTDETTYPVPEDFGRLLMVRDQLFLGTPGTGQSGLFLAGGTLSPFPLHYDAPIAFRSGARAQRGKPHHFTLSGRQLILDPPPDDNQGDDYVGQGVYMARVERPDLSLEGEIYLDEPSVLVAATLYQLAADRGVPQVQTLLVEQKALLGALVNNAARARMKLFTQRWPARWTR
jgi:hypothetical protein